MQFAGGDRVLPDRADGRRRQLIELLFGLDYTYAVFVVGGLMILYVSFGGMTATTWVQIIKAGMFLAGAALIAVLTLAQFDFNLSALVAKAVAVHPRHAASLAPAGLLADPVSGISLGIALVFGTAGLPHILMRFFTVADARAARVSVFYTTLFIGCFFLMVMVIGFGAVAWCCRTRPTAPPQADCAAGRTWPRSISPMRWAARR